MHAGTPVCRAVQTSGRRVRRLAGHEAILHESAGILQSRASRCPGLLHKSLSRGSVRAINVAAGDGRADRSPLLGADPSPAEQAISRETGLTPCTDRGP